MPVQCNSLLRSLWVEQEPETRMTCPYFHKSVWEQIKSPPNNINISARNRWDEHSANAEQWECCPFVWLEVKEHKRQGKKAGNVKGLDKHQGKKLINYSYTQHMKSKWDIQNLLLTKEHTGKEGIPATSSLEHKVWENWKKCRLMGLYFRDAHKRKFRKSRRRKKLIFINSEKMQKPLKNNPSRSRA